MVCIGIGWIARSVELLTQPVETRPDDEFSGRGWNILNELFARLFDECMPSETDPSWWSADDSVTLTAHAVVRESMALDVDLADVIFRGFRGCREELTVSPGELLEREVFKGSWFAVVLHACAHLTRLRPSGPCPAGPALDAPVKSQVYLSGGLDAALFRSLSLHYGWFRNTCSAEAVSEEIRRRAALVNLYYCASDYAVGDQLERHRLKYRLQQVSTSMPGSPALRAGLRRLADRNRIVRDAMDLRAIVDRLWADMPRPDAPQPDGSQPDGPPLVGYDEPDGLRLAKATAALCNVVEWGPMVWLTDPGERQVRRMIMMWALIKQVADICDLSIEHHETGNTARYLDGELDNVLAVREQILDDSDWPYRDLLINTEMYELIGERHRNAERFADDADQETAAICDAWEPAVRCMAGCPVHQRYAAPAAARSWTSKMEMRAAAELIRNVISAPCAHECGDVITHAAHSALNRSSAVRRIFKTARREIAAYTSGPYTPSAS
jgi:hypothetical protein